MTQIADGGEILTTTKPVSLTKPAIIVLILASVLVLAVGIGAGIVIFSPRTYVPVNQPDANTGPLVSPVPAKPKSKLATDSALLQLKSDLAGFTSELDRVDLIEPQLASPNIDLNISVQIK